MTTARAPRRSWIAGLAAALAACGGAAAGPSPAILTGTALASGESPGASVVLYQDGAWLHVRRAVQLPEGTSRVAVPMPAGVPIEDVSVVATGARVLAVTRPVLAAEPRPEVAAGSASGWSTDLAPGVPSRVGDEAPQVELVLAREGDGAATVEVAAFTSALTWRAGYTLVREGAWGRFGGAVVIDSPPGFDLGLAAVSLVDAPSRGPGADPDGDGDAGNDDGAAEAPPSAPVVPLVLAEAAPVRGGELRVPLALGDDVVRIEALTVVDVVGPRFNRSSRTPSQVRSYGDPDGAPPVIEQHLQLTLPGPLAAAGVPTGDLALFERVGGQTLALGRVRMAAPEVVEGAPPAVPGQRSIVVGGARHLTVRRKQTDFAVDLPGKRVVEEFTLTLTSTSTSELDVAVREHLHRGLNWTLAYWTPNAVVTKEQAQRIALRVRVPAKATRTVAYRVVYTW